MSSFIQGDFPGGKGFPQMIKNLPAMQETWVQSMGWEDPLEEEMATHSSIFAWRIPWTEEPGRQQSVGSQSQTRLSDFTSLHFSFSVSCKIISVAVQKLFSLMSHLFIFAFISFVFSDRSKKILLKLM